MRLEQSLALSDKDSVIERQGSVIERQASQIAKLEEEKQTLARKLMKSKDKQKIQWELMGYKKPISQKIYLHQLSKPFCSHLLLKTNYQVGIEKVYYNPNTTWLFQLALSCHFNRFLLNRPWKQPAQGETHQASQRLVLQNTEGHQVDNNAHDGYHIDIHNYQVHMQIQTLKREGMKFYRVGAMFKIDYTHQQIKIYTYK
ncbi:hypothetical protein FGO68_gene15514 [Halteria grandinella]|uniref:Uncharacterized protein n=1 Tax=Halteria grandinella TaxID=5974 RepID=A0A8J8T3L2_HALGN|nr:hypothetical protein FGO68_gene15514 [Halteria grandinella]